MISFTTSMIKTFPGILLCHNPQFHKYDDAADAAAAAAASWKPNNTPKLASFPGLPTASFWLLAVLHTASNQKLDGGKAWERGYSQASNRAKLLPVHVITASGLTMHM